MDQTQTEAHDIDIDIEDLREKLDKTLARIYKRLMNESATIIVHSCYDIILRYRNQGMTFEMIVQALQEMNISIKPATLRKIFAAEQKRRLQAERSSGGGEEQERVAIEPERASAPSMAAPASAPAPSMAAPTMATTATPASTPDQSMAVPATATTATPASDPAPSMATPAPAPAPVPAATPSPAPAQSQEPSVPAVSAPSASATSVAKPLSPAFEIDIHDNIFPPEILGRSGKPVRALPQDYIKMPGRFKLRTPTPEELEDYKFETSIRPLVNRLLEEFPKAEKEYAPLKPLRTYKDRNGKIWDVLSDLGPRVDQEFEREHTIKMANYLNARRRFLESLGIAVFHCNEPTPRYMVRADLRPPLKVPVEELERLVKGHLEP